MGNFFENLNDLFSTWAKGLQDSQKQNQQNQGAGTSAPSFESVGSTLLDGIGDAVSSAWTGFLNKVQESNKQNIQAGNYTTNPETVHLESPFGNHDNLMEKATAKPEEPKKKNPWEFENPFNDPILDDMYAKTVFELDEADPDMKQGTGIMKDAYDLTTRYAMDVFASDELLPEKDKRDPLAIAEKGWRDALDGKKAEYAAFGKSGKEIEGLLQAQEGWQTEKQHREKQNQGIIAAAEALRDKNEPTWRMGTEQEQQEKENRAGAYERLPEILENVWQMGGMAYALSNPNDAALYQQMMNSPNGKALIDRYMQGTASADEVRRYGQTMAAEVRGGMEPKNMTLDEAEKYLSEQYPMYGLAKDTQGSMDAYSAAYGDIQGIARKIQESGVESLTDAEDRAWQDAISNGPEWLSGWLVDQQAGGMGGANLNQDQAEELAGFSAGRLRQMEEAKGLFSPYEMTPYQQGLWEQYVNTPEGAAQWAEDAQGTKDEQKAKDNLWRVERQSKYDEVASWPDFAETSKAKEDFHSGNDGFDNKYNVINNIGGAGDRAAMLADIGGSSSYAVSLYYFMKPKEKGIFNSYAHAGAIDAANEYLDYLSYAINERMTKEGTERMRAMSESGVGGAIVGSAVSVPLSIARGVGYLDQLVQNVAQAFTGRPVDRNSQANMIGMLADSAREGVQNQVDWNVNILGQDVDVFDFLYGTAMSGIDSFAAGQLGAALGGIASSAEKAQKLASWTGAAILGGGAAQSAMQDAYDRGANDGTALLLGAIAGANETLWEHWSIGNLIKHGQDVGKKTFAEEIKNAFAEAGVNASEEFNTSLANGIAEYFLNHDDREVQKKADEYERLGLSPEAALEKARGEFWASAVMDAAGGALMGGVFGSVENVQNRQNVNRVDKAVGSGFSSESMDTLYSLAESEGASDKAKKLARKFPKGKANAKQMGELFRELGATMGKGIKETLHNMGVADIALQLGQETGAVDRAAAEAVTAMMEGENLTGEQVAAIAANPAAMKIVDALFKPDTDVTSSAADAAPSPQGEGLEPVQFEPMPGMEEAEAKQRQAASAGQTVTPAETAEEAPRQERKVPIRVKGQEESRNITGLGMDGTDVRIETDAGESISLEDADVDAGEAAVIQAAAGMENQDEAAAMIAAWQNGPRLRHQDAGPAQNMGANPETQAEAEAEPAGQGAVMSPDKETARADEARQAQDFAMGFRAVYEAAQAGKTAEGTQSIYADMLAPEARQAAEEAGRQAYERAEAQAEERNAQEAQAAGYRTVKNAGADAVGVLFDRVRDGIKQGGERVNAMLQMLDRAGREFGMQYRVVDKLENDANAKYVKGTNIVYIALDAEEGAITKAASHEGFHFISQFSPDMAKTMTDFVLDKLRQVAGYDIDQRIREVMQQYRDQAGQELTPEAATEEIVADSMLDVIGTRENMEQLMKQSKSTAEKIKEWITNTYQKFKDILNRLARNSPEVAALKDDVDYLGRISSMWQEGMRQAAEAWRQAQVGYNDGSAALEQNQAVQQYRQEMQGDMTVDDRENSLTAFLAQLFMDTQGQWIQAHMDEYEEGLAKYRQALLEYKRGGVALNVALERAGLSPLSGNDIRVASYAADQALTQEGAKERAKLAGVEIVNDGVQYSLASMEKMDWKDQVQRIAMNHGNRGDVMVITKEGEMRAYGIEERITLEQRNFRKATRPEKQGTSRSAHALSIDTMNKLREALLHPVAKITNERGTVFVTDLQDDRGSYIIVPLRKLSYDGKTVVMDAATVYGREIMPTLFGRFENGVFIENENAKIFMYNKNARDILGTGLAQFEAPASVENAINKLSQSQEKVNEKFSLRHTPKGTAEENKSLQDKAIEIFGKTYNWTTTGYLLPDGTKLDFSGKRYGSNGKYREEDHREILEAYGEDSDLSGTEAMIDFMGRGAMRIMPESGGIQMQTPPTKQQLQALDGFIGKMRGEVTIDIDDENGNTVFSMDYDRGTYSRTIIADIPSLFEEAGKSRSETAQFHSRYSLPSQQRQQADTAEAVRQDAELYAQIRQDADSRAALELLMRMHEQTTQGGENALIKPGAFEKRLGEMVERIKEDTATRMSDRAIRKGLRTIYQAMEKQGYSVGEILTYAREFYQQVLEQAPGALVEMDDSTREAVRVLRENPFQLTPDQKSEIKGTYGSLGDFMRKNFGKLKIRNGAKVTLADVWRESLNPLNPGLFAEDTAEADMPGIIDAFLENAHAKKFAGEFGANIGAMATDGAMNLMLDFYDIPGALKQKNEIRAEYQGRYYDQQKEMARLRATAREAVNNAKWMYEQRYNERIERDKATKAEREKKQGIINEIRKAVRPIKTMLMKGTDSRHIPEAMRGAMERMLDNLGGDRAIFDGQEAREIYMKLAKWAADSQLHDAAQAAAYDPDILEKLEWLEEHAGKSKALRSMTAEELEAVRDAVQNIYKMVTEENEIEVAGRKQKVADLAGQVMAEMKERKEASNNPVAAKLRQVGYKEMTPVYYARQVGGTLGRLMMDLIERESDVAFIIKDGKSAFDEAAEKYHLNDWIHDKNHLRFETSAGDTIELTKEMAMTLYAWWEREQRNKTQSAAHLRRGGFTYDRNDKDVRAMKGVNFTKSHVLSQADMNQIKNYLSEEQRAFVEAMVKYLSEDMAEKGNEASMRMFGWKKFGEKWYFPYPTDRNFRGQNSTDAKGQPDRQLKNMGASHALTENAMNPLKLGNFTDIWADHVDEMARYSVLAEKLDNLRRVTNYVVGGAENFDINTGIGEVIAPESVKKEIERALGQEGAHYLEQFLRDINGNNRSDERGLSDKWISLFKKGSVAANLSVVLQQPSAFVRAMSMVKARYFGMGLFNPLKFKKIRERMYQNSGVANLKQWGGFDTNTGSGFQSTLLDSLKADSKIDRAMDFVDEWTGKGAEKADEITWVYMYSAIEAEIDDRTDYRRGTEEFDQAVAMRFDEVMRFTQVYDSAFAKSEWMRSTSTMDKIATSFMAEPTLWINMMMDAGLDVNAKKPGAGKKAARALGVFVAGTFVNSLLQSIATAFRRKKEEGTTWIEKYLSELQGNFEDALSLEGIAGMIPLARDVVSLFQGYDVERADMAVIGNMIDAYRKIQKHIEKGDMPDFDEWMNLAGMAGNMFGVPVRNLYRDLSGIYANTFGGKSRPLSETSMRSLKYTALDNTSWLSFFNPWDASNAAYYDRMEQALIKGDMKQYEELRGYMEETKLVKPDSIDKGIKKEIKESVLGGLISDEKAMDMLKNHFGMDQQKAYYTVDSWQQTEKNKDTENYSYSREGALMAAVKAGQDVKEEMKKLTDNGYTEKELKSDMKSQIGKWYRSGEMTRQEAESKLQKYTGETDRDNMYWLFDKWDYMRKNGSDEGYGKYNTLYELIDTGRDMRQEVQRIVSHGVKPESVSSAITAKYKETYVSLYRSGKTAEAANLKAKLLNALEAAGLNRETKNKAIEYWLKDKQ